MAIRLRAFAWALVAWLGTIVVILMVGVAGSYVLKAISGADSHRYSGYAMLAGTACLVSPLLGLVAAWLTYSRLTRSLRYTEVLCFACGYKLTQIRGLFCPGCGMPRRSD